MPIDSNIISVLLIGEWQSGERFYEFMEGRDIVIYSDYDFPKAEAATFTLTLVDDKHQLEIKHPLHPIKTEVYEIVSIDIKNMVWSYVEGEDIKQIKLVRFVG